MVPLYPRILGERWPELPERLRRSFEATTEMRTSGRFRVRWGERALARWLARWGGFPGWEGQPNPPQRELTILTEGLLPI